MISSILISGAIIVGALAGDDVPKDRTGPGRPTAPPPPGLGIMPRRMSASPSGAKPTASPLSGSSNSPWPSCTIPRTPWRGDSPGSSPYQGKWKRPDDISKAVGDDPQQKELVRQYLERRAKTPDRVDAQLKLARLVRAEWAATAGHRPFPPGPQARSFTRDRQETPGIQESRRPLDQTGEGGAPEAGRREPEEGQQALAAVAGKVPRWAGQ